MATERRLACQAHVGRQISGQPMVGFARLAAPLAAPTAAPCL